MQQLRQVAHALQRGLGDRRSPLPARRWRARAILGPQRDADVHLDRGQRLPHFVVQLAREARRSSSCASTSRADSRSRSLPVLLLRRALTLDLALQPVDVARRHHRHDQRHQHVAPPIDMRRRRTWR